MTALSVQQIGAAGLAPSFTAAAAGQTIKPDDHTSLRVNNASGGSINVTLTATGPCSQGFLHDRVVAVAAGAIKDIAVGPAKQFADATGQAAITYSSTTTVTVAAVRS